MTGLIWITTMLATFGQTEAGEMKMRTLQGDVATGTVASMSVDSVSLETSDGKQEVATDKIENVVFNENAVLPRVKVQVALVDGTLLSAAKYAAAADKASIELADGSRQEVSTAKIKSVRLGEQTAIQAGQWQEFQTEKATSDRLIVRRTGEDGKFSLDVMEGVIGAVSDANVKFTLAGDALTVKSDKIGGLFYFHKNQPALKAPRCVVVDIDGSRWSAEAIKLDSGKLTVTTLSGLSPTIPLERIRQIDFASANQKYVSDVARDTVTRNAWFQTGGSKEKSGGTLLAPLMDRTPSGSIMVGGEVYAKGLWMPAQSSIVLEVPEGYGKLQAKLGVDDHVGATDGARLVIEADGKVLLDQVVSRSARPDSVSIDLGKARRVRVRTDYAGDSHIGDQIVLCEAKFTK